MRAVVLYGPILGPVIKSARLGQYPALPMNNPSDGYSPGAEKLKKNPAAR